MSTRICIARGLIAILIGVGARPATAQHDPRALGGEAVTRVAMALPVAGGPTDSARRSETTLPSVTSSGAPRTYQIVSIPVPDLFASAAEIDVEIIARGEFVVLGAGVRKLGAPGTRKSRLTVTIGIPASALAGKLVAAEARFSTASIGTVVVPVEMSVDLVRGLVIRTGAAPLTGHTGTDIVVPFEIVNHGNAKETVYADLDLPSGWPTRGLKSTAIVIEPGKTLKRRQRVAIPALSSTGSSFVRVDLREGSSILASSTIRIEVSNAASTGRDARTALPHCGRAGRCSTRSGSTRGCRTAPPWAARRAMHFRAWAHFQHLPPSCSRRRRGTSAWATPGHRSPT
jgi:hypothetical protein